MDFVASTHLPTLHSVVTFGCRIVQWRHQVLRRKGYLKFYRKMKNVRRIPFVIVSLANAVIMLFVCLLYIFRVDETWADHGLHAVDFLYIIVGVEVILSLPCLIYYIGENTACVKR